jgi:polyisoprenoid-binding protein YceI
VRIVALALLLALPVLGCREKPKRVVRTEPWLAPVVSASGASEAGKPLRYSIDQASVELELPARRGKPRGKLGRVEGSIDFDPVHLDRTRARLTADLLSLTMSSAGEDDPTLLARAFDWLELGAERAPVDRARDRYAVLNITALEAGATPEEAGKRRAARVVAHGDLTLHHFRVPVVLELEVELKSAEGAEPATLLIRTRKPLVVSLVAHDILPRDARGALLSNQLSAHENTVGREARVTAELRARPSPLPEPTNP